MLDLLVSLNFEQESASSIPQGAYHPQHNITRCREGATPYPVWGVPPGQDLGQDFGQDLGQD